MVFNRTANLKHSKIVTTKSEAKYVPDCGLKFVSGIKSLDRVKRAGAVSVSTII